ncbi:MAG TPA: hypothetical protein DCW74_20255 [Alteromonas australica]|uniref:Uncharacterized protein n=2 Tax=Alteromonadales TaxID=135622 RepID=A0A350P9T9_9ALTE|nr:hypothetical protein [Alteromonas australica]HAR55264.1 hypothetical protein [Idiomarina baltica]HAW78056.1 hypothetical protein [Alteromonas australica]|tara:strand:+ start:11042 stop:11599 length:558 start_codon:yes stop_codon:yes gene_type:complete
MIMKRITFGLTLLSAVLLFSEALFSGASFSEEPYAEQQNIPTSVHQVTAQTDPATCLGCHKEMPSSLPQNGRLTEVNRKHFHTDDATMSTSCHDPSSAKHMLGKFSPEQLPPHMALSKDGRVTCLTCHFVHGELEDDKPWANVGLFEKLFNSEKLYKTYLLRETNVNGELCLTCHHADGYADEIK